MTQPPDPPGPPGGRHTSGTPWQVFLAAPLGIVLFVVVNAVFIIVSPSGYIRSLWGQHVVVIVGAVILLLVALAGIPLVVRGTSYFVKGLGIGLMIGWALASIVSAGYCTGINPGLYSALPL